MKSENNPLKKAKIKADTSWEGEVGWYDNLLESGVETYQCTVILPNLVRLLAPRKGQVVLDLACGQGFFSREIAKSGALVSGVDISAGLIEVARKRSPEIHYYVSPADKLGFIKDASVDGITCVLAIQNIENVSGVLAESSRVLKKGGRLILVLNHPAFRIPGRSGWGFDEERKSQFRRIDEYMSESRQEIVMHPGDGKQSLTVSFHRPLQYYFKALGKVGFAVSRLEEWVSDKTSEKGPRQIAENKSRREFPLFMAIVAEKI